MVSHTFYTQHTEEFYDFYKNKMIFLDAKPNKAHLKLAEMEQAGKVCDRYAKYRRASSGSRK